MFRSEFPALPRNLAPAPAPVAAAAGDGASRFGPLFAAVRGEISDFIEFGAADGPALTAAGRAFRLRAAQANVQSQGQSSPEAVADATPGGGPESFLSIISGAARKAAARLGVAPEAVAAVAALESGWGQRRIRHADGSDTYNLFAIKAQPGWEGGVASVATTEYENGVALRKTERFRSYPDQAAAFGDFTRLLLGNPRYHAALNTGGDLRAFAEGLARGGYASDPDYAGKLVRTAQRLQRGG